MATISASFAGPDRASLPRSAGYVKKSQSYVTSATLSAGDVIVFSNLKIPTGAVLTDVALHSKTPDGSVIFQIGIVGGITSAAAFGSATASATGQLDTLLPVVGTSGYRVSVSDDAAIRTVTMALTVDGAAVSPTASVSLCLTIGYTMNKAA